MQTNALELIHTCKPLETLFLRSISVSPKKEMLTETMIKHVYPFAMCSNFLLESNFVCHKYNYELKLHVHSVPY